MVSYTQNELLSITDFTKSISKILGDIKEHTIDSITKYNNTVINNIKHIDNIKNEEIKHVQILNNDSTVILFYQLINE